MIQIHKINNQKVCPIKTNCVDPDKIKGFELFPELYSNIFLLAKKKSGKTSTIFTILKKCCTKLTTVYIFASTVNKDPNWLHIIEWLEKKGINVICNTSIMDGNKNNLDLLIQELGNPEEKKEDKIKSKIISFGDDSNDEKKNKPKKTAPEYTLIFDDLSTELSNKSIPALLKKNRHYKMKIIISSQYYNDIPKDGRQQLDYILLFPKIPNDKLEMVYSESDIGIIPYPIYMRAYEDATKEKYNFLYIDLRDEQMRKNFSHAYKIS